MAQGPTAISLATPDTIRLLPLPVVVRLALGAAKPLREVITMSPLELEPEIDIIPGWDWLCNPDLRFLYPQGVVVGGGTQGPISAPLQVPAAPADFHEH